MSSSRVQHVKSLKVWQRNPTTPSQQEFTECSIGPNIVPLFLDSTACGFDSALKFVQFCQSSKRENVNFLQPSGFLTRSAQGRAVLS